MSRTTIVDAGGAVPGAKTVAFAGQRAARLTPTQLCPYCKMLPGMKGTGPARFHVVTPLAEEAYRPADFAAYFRLIRSCLRGAVTAVPAPNTYPEPVSHCDVCNYWKHCDDQ